MRKKLAWALAGGIVCLFLFSYLLPRFYDVKKDIFIRSPLSTAADQIHYLSNWQQWVVWLSEKIIITHQEKEPRIGDALEWKEKHNDKIKGKLIITDISSDTLTSLLLTINDQLPSPVTFHLSPVDSGTHLHFFFQTDAGYNPVIRFLLWFKHYGSIIDNEWEHSLRNLKKICETSPHKEEKIKMVEFKNFFRYLSIRKKIRSHEVTDFLRNSYKILIKAIKDTANIAGSPFAIYHDWQPDSAIVEAGIPIHNYLKQSHSSMRQDSFIVKRAIRAVHYGSHQTLADTYQKINTWIKQHKIYPTGAPWEVYHTPVHNPNDSTKWITEIFFPTE